MNIEEFLKEDDLGRNSYYFQNLPTNEVSCVLKIKEKMLLSGLLNMDKLRCRVSSSASSRPESSCSGHGAIST